MLTATTVVTVLKADTREGSPAADGTVTSFVNFLLLSGSEPVKAWGYAKDFSELPVAGSVVTVEVEVKAKPNKFNAASANLSVRVKGFAA